MSNKVTQEMVENWLGDTITLELLTELANGEYVQEQFKQDIIDTWQHDGVVKEKNKSLSIEDRLDFIKDDIWDLNDKLTSICIKLNIEEDDNA
jgi:hypothetical protein|tara:strand:+ start:1116 stop:1394 length:279 start_codon:yes stop_codon:yes gene_type:complete